MIKLYDFQEAAVKEIHKLFKTKDRVGLAWYTGSGKTNVFLAYCKSLIEKNPDVKIGISSFLTVELKDQVHDRLKLFGLEEVSHKIMAGQPIPSNKNIYIFNPQGVTRRIDQLVKFDLLIVDEGHTGLADECKMLPAITHRALKRNGKILVVSATIWDILKLKKFKDMPLLNRPLDQGLADGLSTDFDFKCVEADIEIDDKNFTRIGDLKADFTEERMALMKSVCEGKMAHLIKNEPKRLGKKCLVICPPGNHSEVARHLAEKFKGLLFIQSRAKGGNTSWKNTHGEEFVDTSKNLEIFKTDSTQFLFVVNKCQVGFDMTSLDCVIDLTMTRNIKVLAQRVGRISRKNGERKKTYIYVYDKGLGANRVEWLLLTMVDFCLGAYIGWSTKTAKYRALEVHSPQITAKDSFSLKDVISALRSKDAIAPKRVIKFIQATEAPRRAWTLKEATEAAKKHDSRTEMWAKQPALYKWFRLNAKEEMDRIFPLKNKIGRWNEKAILEAMAKCTDRYDFRSTYRGAVYWVSKNWTLEEWHEQAAKFWGKPAYAKWNDARVHKAISKIRVWSEIRTIGGLRRWMNKNGTEKKWQKVWETEYGGKMGKTGRPRAK